VEIFVTDQSGNPVDPDVVLVEVKGELIEPTGLEKGRFGTILPFGDIAGVGNLTVDIYDNDFLSPAGSHHFERNYELGFPKVEMVQGELKYVGGLEQRIVSYGLPYFIFFNGRSLIPEDLTGFTASVMTDEGVYTGVSSNITFKDGSWTLDDLNVSSIFEGDHYLEVVLRVKYNPPLTAKGITFNIEHELYFMDGEQSLDAESKMLSLEGLRIMSTYSGHSPMTDELLNKYAYEIFTYSEVKLGQIGYFGDLVYDGGTMTFGFSRDLSELPLGMYRFSVRADADHTDEKVLWSDVFSLDLPAQISDFKVRYTAGMQQVLEVYDIHFYLSSQMTDEVPMDEVVSAKCDIVSADLETTGISKAVPRYGEGWGSLTMNLSSLEEDEYIVRVSVKTVSFGSNEAFSDPFQLIHKAMIIPPSITYDRKDHTLDITNIRVVSSYVESGIMPVKMEILGPSTGVSLDVTGSVRYLGGTWNIRDLEISSYLPEGDDYYLRMTFWVDGDELEGSSDQFTVNYELSVSTPSVRYVQEYDVLEISDIRVVSPYKDGSQVPQGSIETGILRVYNSSSGELLHEQHLVYSSGMFGCEITRPFERFGTGEIDLEAILATALSGNYSARSEGFMLKQAGDIVSPDDDDVSAGEDGGVEWYLVVIMVLIALILVIFLMILVLIQVKWRKVQEIAAEGPAAVSGIGSLPPSLQMKESLPPKPIEALPEVEYLRPGSSDGNGK